MQTDGLISSILTVFFPVFSSKRTTQRWTDRTLLLAICLPCLAPEHVFPVWKFLLLGTPLITHSDTPVMKTAYHSISLISSTCYSHLSQLCVVTSRVYQSWHFKMQRKEITAAKSFGTSPEIVLFQAEVIPTLWAMQKQHLNQDWVVVRCLFC